MSGRIIATAQAICSDPNDFSKTMQTCIEGLDGQDVEVHYHPLITANGQITYTALFIGREK